MKKINLYAALAVISFTNLSFGGTMGPTSPQSGYFLGLGGNYNSVKLNRYLPTVDGTSNVFDPTTGALAASGAAEGPAIPFHNTQTTFSPAVQTGYFKYFNNQNDWLYGLKFQYQYVGLTATNSNIIAPQYGQYVNATTGAVTPFTGRALVGSDQVYVDHLFALMPYLATTVTRSKIYLGVGPALFGSRGKIYNIVGFADVAGQPTDITGFAGNIAPSRQWIIGGIAQIGMTYNIATTWFVDVNYSYAMSKTYSTTYFKTFSNLLTTGNPNSGTLLGISSQNITIQTLGASINKVFSL